MSKFIVLHFYKSGKMLALDAERIVGLQETDTGTVVSVEDKSVHTVREDVDAILSLIES